MWEQVPASWAILCASGCQEGFYAVEASSIADQACEDRKLNQMEDTIEVIKATLETIELAEQVDVIVSEWMG